MNRRLVPIIAVLLALVVVMLVVWRQPETNEPTSANRAASERYSGVSPSSQVTEPKQGATAYIEESGGVTKTTPMYQMTSLTGSFEPVEHITQQENQPFRIQGRGSKAKIVTKEGDTLLEADETVGIYGCSVSPNGKRIAVYFGDATYDIITPSTGETIRLPQQPPGENMLGFGSWHWLNDRKLLGVSGKTIPFRDNQVGPEREEPTISRCVLYLYDLEEKTMAEVALPPALRMKTISVSAVDETGKVQLRPEGHQVSFTDAALGWFEIRPKE